MGAGFSPQPDTWSDAAHRVVTKLNRRYRRAAKNDLYDAGWKLRGEDGYETLAAEMSRRLQAYNELVPRYREVCRCHLQHLHRALT